MRVGIVHNAYRHRGGEDRVVEVESDLLSSFGHEVHTRIFDNRSIFATLGQTLSAVPAMGLGWNRNVGDELARWAHEKRLDVVHFHNIYPVVTPAALERVHRSGVPVVMTLHNFRPLCAGGTMMRDGQACSDCVGGSCVPALKHKCYRNSRLQTASWAMGSMRSSLRDVWNRAVDQYIAPSSHVRDRYAAAGFCPSHITVHPHTVPAARVPVHSVSSGALFVGRLDAGKGALELASMWGSDMETLTIIGVGPELEGIRSLGKDNVRCLGWCDSDEVARHMADARLIVQPSLLLETFGLTVAEAAAVSRPSVAFNRGGPASVIEDGVTGILVDGESMDSFYRTVRALLARPELCDLMGSMAWARYNDLFSPQAGIESLLSVYESAISSRSVACA